MIDLTVASCAREPQPFQAASWTGHWAMRVVIGWHPADLAARLARRAGGVIASALACVAHVEVVFSVSPRESGDVL